MNTGTETIYTSIARQSSTAGQAKAILASGRLPLSYVQLQKQIITTAQVLQQLDIGRQDRVALVLPDGPEIATTFLAVASVATSAPLNPAYSASEFEFYLKDLQTKALIVLEGRASPAVDVARRLKIPIIKLCPLPDAAGSFSLLSVDLATGGHNTHQAPDFAQPTDVALLLHTSGTTSRPKLVPLTHANLVTSASNIQKTLQLIASDRCLNIMPLFHIHGLVAALLASLQAGGSVVCTPGFAPPLFFNWLATFQPTWYTAVPTMHQAILSQAEQYPEACQTHRLRLIRSSSASLSPTVMHQLEHSFRVPVIEAYGMTEAAHQMASNPLPPLPHKAGSVGLAAGPQVAIMDEKQPLLLPSGTFGEVVIRGDNVMHGYFDNPSANQASFADSWFRTGDQGYLDKDGYLFLTGRLKEIINRGGEKVAPREVDEILLRHPTVAQAVTFAVPHPTLGEDVAAAVILREGSTTTERDLRSFAFAHLANYKVPTQILLVDEIPKGPTGKLQRIGLAEKLAAQLARVFVAPSSPLEEALVGIWSVVLKKESVGVDDNFFTLGGDSLTAVQVAARVRAAFAVELPLPMIFQEPILSDQARAIEELLLDEIEQATEADVLSYTAGSDGKQ